MGIQTYISVTFGLMKYVLDDVHDADVSVVTLLGKEGSDGTVCFRH